MKKTIIVLVVILCLMGGITTANNSIPLGINCSDNGDGTATCTAIWVNTETGNSDDPFAGIFEVPHGSEILEVAFHPLGTRYSTAYGSDCGSYADGWNGNKPAEGFYFYQGCVHGIEFMVGTGRDNPDNWVLTYRY